MKTWKMSLWISLLCLSLSKNAQAEELCDKDTCAQFARKTQKSLVNNSNILKIESLTQARYVTGGVIGSVVGFGIGHGIVGEYKSMGWVFTMSQALSLSIPIVAATVMAIIFWDGSAAGTVDNLITTWGGFLWTGLALWAAFRIWEIIDLWIRPRHRLIKGNPRSTTQPELPQTPKATFMITPTIMPQGGVGLGLVGQW